MDGDPGGIHSSPGGILACSHGNKSIKPVHLSASSWCRKVVRKSGVLRDSIASTHFVLRRLRMHVS